MKLSAFKEALIDRYIILKAGTVYTFQKETAYWANGWGNVLSTFFYTMSMVLFIDVMYSNVNAVAGYARNEMLMFLFMGQISYYSMWVLHSNQEQLILDVNNGDLDVLLVKPMPSMFYVTFRKIKLFSLLRDATPPLLGLIAVINWPALDLVPVNLAAGFIIAGLGVVCINTFTFLATLPVFWLGESTGILDLSTHIDYNFGKVIPFEGFGRNFQIVFSTLVPVLISTAIATSVTLGKLPILPFLLFTICITTGTVIIRTLMWKMAMRAYTSASS